MASLVTDFLVNPVIRQARRFSRSSNNLPTPKSVSPPVTTTEFKEGQDDAISETEEDSYLDDEVDDSLSSTPSSRSSLHITAHHDATDPDRSAGQTDSVTRAIFHNPDLPIHENELRTPSGQAESTPTSNSNMAADRQLPAATHTSPRTERRKSLPEDDGMGTLRKRIFAIQAQDIEAPDKAHLMHQLLIEGYTQSKQVDPAKRPLSPSSPTTLELRRVQGPLDSFKFWQNITEGTGAREEFDLTPEDVQPTFALLRSLSEDTGEEVEDHEYSDYRPFGCEHYRRNVKLQCSTCNRWYTCRFCHDKVENHNLIRKDTKNMLCMFCATAQRASDVCVSCGASAARYYCNICKLWNDDPDKSVYHCNDCGICRIGRGIGKDFFHCKVR